MPRQSTPAIEGTSRSILYFLLTSSCTESLSTAVQTLNRIYPKATEMKSFPSCWNNVLTQLGFRRNRRKSVSKRGIGRRPQFENLESREMLAADVIVSNASDEVNGSTTSIADLIANPGYDGISLREAITAANANPDANVIEFAPGIDKILVTSELEISSSVTIEGPGADLLSIDGQGQTRVFHVTSGGSATLRGLTISGGNVTGNGGGLLAENANVEINDSAFDNNQATAKGGGLYFTTTQGSTLLVSGSTFSRNRSSGNRGTGLGIDSYGVSTTAQIVNTTISNNTGDVAGGAVYVTGDADLDIEIINSTIAKNHSGSDGHPGGLWITSSGETTLTNTILVGNTKPTQGALLDFYQASGTITGIHNLLNATGGSFANSLSNDSTNQILPTYDEAKLAPLGYYGGSTQTHALLPESPAIDNGDLTTLILDQRGFKRLADIATDIGAFELSYLRSHGKDYDGDQREDLIAVDETTGTLSVVTYPAGQATYSNWLEVGGFTLAGLVSGDFDGDGRDDVAFKPAGDNWQFGFSDGTAFFTVASDVSEPFSSNKAGDFDNDGRDEIVYRDSSSGTWKVMQVDALGNITLEDWGAGLLPSYLELFVGDANRDGRDDLIFLKTDNQWEVSLSESSHTFSTAPDTAWADWFDGYLTTEGLDAEGPYQEVLDIFSKVYNEVELELYPGLMKGIQATEDTKAGNPWDQAALLVDELEPVLGQPNAEIASGKVRVAVEELQKWLGVETPVAAYRVIKSSLDGFVKSLNASSQEIIYVGTIDEVAFNTNIKFLEFTHAWVRAKVPTATGFDFIDLDPSLKFKDRQEGIDLQALVFNATNPQGLFDEYEYLSLDPSIDRRLPLEFFEDELMDYLVQYRPGMSLADVPRDGPIITQTFERLPEGWETGVEIVDAGSPGLADDVQEYDNLQAIFDNEDWKMELTHRVELSVDREAGTTAQTTDINFSSDPLFSYGNWNSNSTPSEPHKSISISVSTLTDLVLYEGADPNAPVRPGDEYIIDLSDKTLESYSPLEFIEIERHDFLNPDVDYSILNELHVGSTNPGDFFQIQGTANDSELVLTSSTTTKAIALATSIPDGYTITENTHLSFDVDISNPQGTLHGIGWIFDGAASQSEQEQQYFRFTSVGGGTSTILNNAPAGSFDAVSINNTNANASVSFLGQDTLGFKRYHYEIELGHAEFNFTPGQTQSFSHLVFFTESDDEGSSTQIAQTKFSNVTLYEKPIGSTGTITLPTNAKEIGFNSFSTSFGTGIDFKTLRLQAADGSDDPYELTAQTILEFDVKSNIGQNNFGDSVAIGWDTDGVWDGDNSRVFMLAGNDIAGANNFYKTYSSPDPVNPITQTFRIPIGETSGLINSNTLDLTHLVFESAGYNGAQTPAVSTETVFSNIRLYEPDVLPPSIVIDEADNDALKLTGTSYQTLAVPGGYEIQQDSVLYFRFSSDSQGLDHYIGWDTDSEYGNGLPTSSMHALEQLIKIYGTSSDPTLPDARYTSGGSDQLMAIPIGELQDAFGHSFVGKTISRLVFGVNGGTNENAESIFSEVGLWSPSGAININSNGVLSLFDTAYRSVSLNHRITSATKLSFEVKTTGIGRLHGIGLDTDDSYTNGVLEFYQLFGTDTEYNQSANKGTDTFSGQFQTIEIFLPNSLDGINLKKLVFFTDSGPFVTDAVTTFRNVKVSDELPSTDQLWQHTLLVPEVSQESIQFAMIEGSSNKYRSELYVGGAPVPGAFSGDDIWDDLGDTALITVNHLSPSKFGIPGPGKSFSYEQEVDEVITLGLDANQHSRKSLADLQSELLATLDGNVSEQDYFEDLDELLSYTTAKYWYDFNQSNEVIAGLTGTVSTQNYVGSGIAKARKNLLRESPSDPNDFIIEHLPYLIAPLDMGVDLPNSNHNTLDQNTGLRNQDAWQLVGYNASALEHNAVEEQINSESVSTMKGLQLAMNDANAQVYVLESRVVNGSRVIEHVETLDLDSEGALSILQVNHNFTTNASYLSDSSDGLLKDYLPGQASFVNSFFNSNLAVSTTEGDIRVLLPSDPTVLELWGGAVYTSEKQNSLGFQIKKTNSAPTSGGDSVNKFVELNTNLPKSIFPYASFAGDPVNTANGNMFRDDVDIVFPNLGVPLDFTRHYDSKNKDDIGLGVGWTYSFGDVLVEDEDDANYLVWITSSGQRHKFQANGSSYDVPAELHGTFTKLGSTSYIYKDKSGMEYHFDQKSSSENGLQVRGRLTKQVDNIGNGVNVVYDHATLRGIKEVQDVHDPARRLEFDYNASGVISQIRKVHNGNTVGTWDFTYLTPTIDSQNHLKAVQAPQVDFINDMGEPDNKGPTVEYAYYASGSSKGLMERITEPDGSSHDYEYYPNGRVFRVKDSLGHVETYSYNLLRGLAEFTDENGNTEIYIHQENGLLEKQIHQDRTRQEFTWGRDGTPAEFLMASSTDEVGAVEKFTYYVDDVNWFKDPSHGFDVSATDFRNRELYEATEKQFPGQPTLTTRFDYSSPGGEKSHMINLKEVVVNPGGEDLTTTNIYDSLGRLTKTTDAGGNVTTRSYYAEDGSPEGGLLKTVTNPRGNDTGVTGSDNLEFVTWEPLAESVSVTSGILSIRVTAPGGTGGSNNISIDAIRIDRTDGAYPLTRIIDEDNDGIDNEFHTIGGSYSGGFNAFHGGDRILFNAAGQQAVWTFKNLEPGTYKVSATWVGSSSRSSNVPYEIFDGLPTAEPIATITKDQKNVPVGFDPGFVTTFTYDAAGNVIEAKTDGISTTITTYDHHGNVLSLEDPQGVRQEFVYDALGRQSLAQTRPTDTAPLLTSLFQNDLLGRTRITTDPRGNVTEFVYDERGYLEKQIFADGNESSFEYDGNGNRISETDALGRIAQFKYDSRDRLIETIYPDGTSASIRYNGVGQIAATIDELGRETKFTYDAAGRLKTTTNAAGKLATNQYNSLGQIFWQQDFNQQLTYFFYDDLGRLDQTLVSESGSYLLWTSNDYDATGNLIRSAIYDTEKLLGAGVTLDVNAIKDTINTHPQFVQVTQFKYDALNRLIETIHADGTSTHTVYDNVGRVKYQYDELTRKTELKYDNYGRLAETIAPDPDGPQNPATSPKTRYHYDAAGNQTKVIDPRGNATEYLYDKLNRLVTVKDALASESHTLYDKAGQLVATVDALGRATYSLRDKRGRVILSREADPDGNDPLTAPQTRREYDAVGNLIRLTDPLGNVTQYEYDELNRLLEKKLHLSPEVLIIDDGDPAYRVERSLENEVGITIDGFGGDARLLAPVSGSNAIAEYSFTNLEPGDYRVFATWEGNPQATSGMSVVLRNVVTNGLTNLTNYGDLFESGNHRILFGIDQTVSPTDELRYDEGTPRIWNEVFANVTVLAGGTREIVLWLRSGTDEKLIADAVRLERILEPVTRTYTYDDNGNLMTETDTLDRTTTYEYDALNRVTKVTLPDPDGTGTGNDLPAPVTETNYDGYGNVLTTIENRGGGTHQRTTAYSYDQRNRVLTETLDAGGVDEVVTQFGYDAVGNLISQVDAFGTIDARTDYEYDNLDRLTAELRYRNDSDPFPLTTRFQYDAAGNLTRQSEITTQTINGTDRSHQSATRFTYDALNRLASTTREDGIVWEVLHENFEVDTQELNVRLNMTETNKFVAADAVRIDRLGPNGALLDTRIIDNDPSGDDPRFTLTTSAVYEATNNTIAEFWGDTTVLADFGAAVWNFTGLENGTYRVSTLWVSDPNSRDDTALYEIFNGPVDTSADATATPDQQAAPVGFTGATTNFAYDAVGNLTHTTDPNGHTSSSTYDRLNRLIKTTAPDPDGNPATNNTPLTTYTYDAIGQLVEEKNGEGESRRYAYDTFGNQIRDTDGENHSTHSRFDSEGNLLSFTDRAGNTTTYTYDALNRIKTDTITLSTGDAVRTYTYNAQGNLQETIDREGWQTIYDYDRLDRKLVEQFLDATGQIVEELTWQFDDLGRVTHTEDGEIGRTFVYDDIGRVLLQRDDLPTSSYPNYVFEHRFVYDVLDTADWNQFVRTVVTQHFLNGEGSDNLKGLTTYFTDRRGHLAKIHDSLSDEKIIEFIYDDADHLMDVARTATDGFFFFETRYNYDNAGRVTGIEHTRDGDDTPFTEYGYQYDQADQITSLLTEHDPTLAAFPDPTELEVFTFDQSGQLTDVFNVGPAAEENFVYDENGNRTTSSANGTTVVGEYNRILEDADYTYQYDKEGNQTHRTNKSDGTYLQYTWDHRNRLTRVRNYDINDTPVLGYVTYKYDTDDQQFERLWFTQIDSQSSLAIGGERFIYNGDQLSITTGPSVTQLSRRTLWGPGVDQLLVDEVFQNGGLNPHGLWAANDHLGTVHDLLADNSYSGVEEHRKYDAFGAIDAVFDEAGQAISSAEMQSDFGFAGRIWDNNAELYYNKARWYDPHSGRFLSEDPIQEGANWYRYAGNDPINFRDPTGLSQAGNPLNNLFNGGFGGNVVRQENTSLRNLNTNLLASPTLNYNSFAGPVRNTVSRSTPVSTSSLSTSNLLNQLSTPSYVPTARELTNFGPAQSFRSIATSNPYATSKLPRTVEQFNRFDQATVTDSGGRTRTVVDFGGKLLAFDPKTGYETGELLNTIQGESGGTYQTFATPSVAQNLKILENPSTLTLGLQGAGGAGLVASKTLGQAALIAGREFAENAIDLAAEQLLGTSIPVFNPTRLRGGTPSVTLGAAKPGRPGNPDHVADVLLNNQGQRPQLRPGKIGNRVPDGIGKPGQIVTIRGQRIDPGRGRVIIIESERFNQNGQLVSAGRRQIRDIRAAEPNSTIVVTDPANINRQPVIYRPGHQPPQGGHLPSGTPIVVPFP